MSRTLERIKKEGFDQSYESSDLGHVKVRCSQCEALVINGVACHERGCPNARKKNDGLPVT
jgi:hypothetical protein